MKTKEIEETTSIKRPHCFRGSHGIISSEQGLETGRTVFRSVMEYISYNLEASSS